MQKQIGTGNDDMSLANTRKIFNLDEYTRKRKEQLSSVRKSIQERPGQRIGDGWIQMDDIVGMDWLTNMRKNHSRDFDVVQMHVLLKKNSQMRALQVKLNKLSGGQFQKKKWHAYKFKDDIFAMLFELVDAQNELVGREVYKCDSFKALVSLCEEEIAIMEYELSEFEDN